MNRRFEDVFKLFDLKTSKEAQTIARGATLLEVQARFALPELNRLSNNAGITG